MFTGLVEEVGRVVAVEARDQGTVLTVAASFAGDVEDGDSVANNGLCLTVVRHDSSTMAFDVMNESLRRSALDDLKVGSTINLERAVRADTRLGGHVVTGHIDGVGTATSATDDGFARVLRVDAAEDLLRHIVGKGSICVDGVSLTVASVDERGFTVSLIPETLDRTTLGELCKSPAGRRVNLETDLMAKHLEKLVAATLPQQVTASVAAYLDENGTIDDRAASN